MVFRYNLFVQKHNYINNSNYEFQTKWSLDIICLKNGNSEGIKFYVFQTKWSLDIICLVSQSSVYIIFTLFQTKWSLDIICLKKSAEWNGKNFAVSN